MSKNAMYESKVKTYKGKIVDQDGKLVFKTKLMARSMEMDLDLEELFEEFAGKGVEVTIDEASTEPPLYAGRPTDWTDLPGKDVDPGYRFCSDEGRERFLDMKIGLMVHFGLYSHLGLLESWCANAERGPRWFLDVYYTLWQVFNPTGFDAGEWARLARRAGMQFIQITTKHHEGFCLWDTTTTTKVRKRIGHLSTYGITPVVDAENHFSVMDSPFKRDIIKELGDAFRKEGLGFGLYFSHIDWNDPNFRWDPANRSYDPQYNPDANPGDWKAFIDRERQQLAELCSNYGRIDQIFFDGSWYGLAWDEMKAIIKEVRRLQPDCMISDRGTGPYADFTSPERWIPAEPSSDDRVKHPLWQVCDPIGTHWSYVPDEVYKDKQQLLRNIIDVVAKGGTIVLDQGPMGNGKFPQEAIDVLEYIGRWLAVNGEAIYATRPWTRPRQGESMFFTRSKDGRSAYAILIGWPPGPVEIHDMHCAPGGHVTMLGVDGECPWEREGAVLAIEVPGDFNRRMPCEHAFVLKVPQP